MFDLFNLRIDRFSFWLGFAAACILWWLAGRLRPLLPQWWAMLRETMDRIKQENLAGVDGMLRTETVRRAQSQHLAAALFSLDEIIFEPRLLAPPVGVDPSHSQSTSSIASQVVPVIPDWPEILASYGVPSFSPLEALQYGQNIAIIGQPGSGKSTALAFLACQIARQEDGKRPGTVPLYLHAFDIHLSPEVIADPLSAIIKEMASRTGIVRSAQLKQFLQSVLRDKQRKVVLLIDGLDELNPGQLNLCASFIQALQNEYPRLQTVVSASGEYLDGLTKINFYPLGLTAWTAQQRMAFAEKWGGLWNKYVVPEVKKSIGYKDIDPVIFNNWLQDETTYLSPLEWTLRIWGAYAGDLSGCSPVTILDTHIGRFLPNLTAISALEEVAKKFIQSESAALPYGEIEKIISNFKPPKSTAHHLLVNEPATTSLPLHDQHKKAAKVHRDIAVSIGEQVVTNLIAGGILTDHGKDLIRFSNPLFLGFLAGMNVSEEEASALSKNLRWAPAAETLHFAAAFNENLTWVSKLIDLPQPPLYSKILITCRWLRDASTSATWRSSLMRTLVSLLQNETIPISMRLRFIAAFFLSRDPSTTRLFKQLLSSQSPIIRRVALIGCGMLGDPQLINDILVLLKDTVSDVRYTACLALSAIPAEPALNAIVEILLSGDEELRQAAAESLALNEREGKKLLEEAASIDDLLTRRAAVFGIVQIHQPWAKQMLEKMAVEDSQWVVRNAAAQALDSIQHSLPTIPRPLPPASEAAWLLAFASKMGIGILPGQDPTDLLMTVLKTGSEEEQVSALAYLRNNPSESVVNAIYQLLDGKNDALHEAALYALWWIRLSGYELPETATIK